MSDSEREVRLYIISNPGAPVSVYQDQFNKTRIEISRVMQSMGIQRLTKPADCVG